MASTFPKLTRLAKPASPDRFGIAVSSLGNLLIAWQQDAVVRVNILPAGGEDYVHELFQDWEWKAKMTRDDKAAQKLVNDKLFSKGTWTGVFPSDVTLAFYGTDFQWEAMRKMLKVPSGKTKSYAEIAAAANAPRAARAVGTVCAKNPLALIVPCHRILASQGRLGGYGYGSAIKRQLLEWEAK